MLAILDFIAAIIGGLLLFLGGHTHDVLWLLVIGLALVAAEVAWGVHRSGWYRRVP